MDLRQATDRDADRIVELWLAMMAEHAGFDVRIRLTANAGPAYRSYLGLHLTSPSSLVLAAWQGAEIRGFCCSYICRNLPMFDPAQFGYVSDIYIEPDFRARGVGSRLLEKTTEWMRARGLDVLQLQVYRENVRGRAFWDSRGFRPFFDRMWLDL